jgi:hypothetical protein
MVMLNQITESRSIGRSDANSSLSSQHPNNNAASGASKAATAGGRRLNEMDTTGEQQQHHRPQLHVAPPTSASAPPRDSSVDSNSPGTRRLRRRVDGNFASALSLSPENRSPVSSSSIRRDHFSSAAVDTADNEKHRQHRSDRRRNQTQQLASDDQQSAEELGDAVGQLSLNEDETFRYHGKASGLHLLEQKISGEVARNEGRIWCVVFSVHRFLVLELAFSPHRPFFSFCTFDYDLCMETG